MELKIRLEDERLCEGCPFNRNRLECHGGFRRELAVVVEQESESDYLSLAVFGRRSESGGEKTIGYALVRPQSCILANERAHKAIELMRNDQPMTATEAAMRSPKRVFVCSKCQSQHKPHEQCRFQRRK